MTVLDGKKVSTEIQDDLALKVLALKKTGDSVPHLAAVLVGEEGASETYVASKVKACEKIGFGSSLIRKATTISEKELLNEVKKLNDDPHISGILVQLPLPDHISVEKITEAISPHKDVD